MPPASSQSLISNPPRPGSRAVPNPSDPPLTSTSPFSGASSSNTNTDSFAVWYGVSVSSTLSCPACPAPVCPAFAAAICAGAIGEPPMLWPHLPVPGAKSAPLGPDGQSSAMLNCRLPSGDTPPPFVNVLPASPGRIEM
ncbi:hypothetical protein BCO37747_06900 [Burkholderia contaminans]|nr:hypothetical protein BCO23253_06534 [Burkholderia contaminans]VWD57792.1 hypothetical protein BCO37747_06900 [Burkholderia contaminans]